jgi:uncharacterized protein (TIGR02147 family)
LRTFSFALYHELAISGWKNVPMVNVFDFVDHRQYLAEWFEEKKVANPNYSYQVFSQKAGFSNRGFVYNIIKGTKHLSVANCAKISKAIEHNRYETDYFQAIVGFTQAVTLDERNQYYEKFSQIKNKDKGFTPAQILRNDQYEYFSKWYYSVVRSLIDMYEFRDDYRWLAHMVTPAISVPQARQSVSLLERLGLIAREPGGRYRIRDKSISSGKDITGLATTNFHIECTHLAENALRELPREERTISGLTLGISQRAYEAIRTKVAEFQEEIMQIANSDAEANRVFQFNVHFFPLTVIDTNAERHS